MQITGDVSQGDKVEIPVATGVVCWVFGVSFAYKGAICAVVRGTDAIFQMGVCSGRLLLVSGFRMRRFSVLTCCFDKPEFDFEFYVGFWGIVVRKYVSKHRKLIDGL